MRFARTNLFFLSETTLVKASQKLDSKCRNQDNTCSSNGNDQQFTFEGFKDNILSLKAFENLLIILFSKERYRHITVDIFIS